MAEWPESDRDDFLAHVAYDADTFREAEYWAAVWDLMHAAVPK